MTRHCTLAALLACVIALASAAVMAGPTTVRDSSGVQWKVSENDDAESENDEYLLEKLRADRKPDPAFGRGGRVGFDFGPSDYGSMALRVDPQARAWVLGTSMAVASSVPMVLRFTPDGQPDTTWGARGRNNAGPPGQRSVGHDLLPLPDGTVWIAGAIAGPRNDQRAGLWRMTRQGAVDMSFAPGGTWQRPGAETSQALSLVEGDRGEILVGILVRTTTQPMLEIWTLAPGAKAPTLTSSEPADEDVDEEVALQRRGNAWVWKAGPVIVSIAGVSRGAGEPAALAAASAPDVGHGGYSPFITAAPASIPEPSIEATFPWELVITGVVLLVAGIALWRMRARRP